MIPERCLRNAKVGDVFVWVSPITGNCCYDAVVDHKNGWPVVSIPGQFEIRPDTAMSYRRIVKKTK